MPSVARPPSERPPVGAVLALTATTVLALALWGSAFWHLGTTGGAMMTAPTAQATVLACTSGPIGPGCTVRYDAPDGNRTTRSIDRPGLIGAARGETVPVWIAADGSIGVAGWRAWVDGLLLLALAVAMTSSAIRWFAQVLRHGDPRTVVDLEDEIDQLRRRDVG